MNSPKISVIMPVYNSEATVSRMVDSIISQTCIDWELIAIDDGSTDASGDILDRYSKVDSRIKVIHKANGGVSSARQAGLEASLGEYVIHADADDYVEPDMLQALYDEAKRSEADVVFCDFFIDNTDGDIEIRKQEPSPSPSETLRMLFRNLLGSCWNKLVRRETLKRLDMRFPEGINYCEDLLTWVQFFQCPDIRISYVPKAFYHYVMSPQSITRAITEKYYEQHKLFVRRCKEILPQSGFERECRKLDLSIVAEGIMNGFIPDANARKVIFDNFRATMVANRNNRWRAGFLFMIMGLYSLGHKLISF